MNNQSDFIQCTYPDCGANIVITEGTDDAVCEHCGASFKVRESDAVKISRIENQTEIENARLNAELEKLKAENHLKQSRQIALIIFGLIILVIIMNLLR